MFLFGTEYRMYFDRGTRSSRIKLVEKGQAEKVEAGCRAEAQTADGPACKIIGQIFRSFALPEFVAFMYEHSGMSEACFIRTVGAHCLSRAIAEKGHGIADSGCPGQVFAVKAVDDVTKGGVFRFGVALYNGQ